MCLILVGEGCSLCHWLWGSKCASQREMNFVFKEVMMAERYRWWHVLPLHSLLIFSPVLHSALVFIFCSLLGLTYMFIHTGLLLSFSFSAPYSAQPICSYTQVCCSRFRFLLPTRLNLYVHTHRFAALVFVFCSLLGPTYMFIHTGLLLSFSFSAPYSAQPICSYTQVCCSVVKMQWAAYCMFVLQFVVEIESFKHSL